MPLVLSGTKNNTLQIKCLQVKYFWKFGSVELGRLMAQGKQSTLYLIKMESETQQSITDI